MTKEEGRSKSEDRHLKSEHPSSYDALLLVSFGGPEGPDEVTPFLKRVTSGRNIPTERLREVAAHYGLFDGVSPINAENRALLIALLGELNRHGPSLTVYWGNRCWHPLLGDTVAQMAADGVHRALALVTSAFGSYPSCRQYRKDIETARAEVGSAAPRIDKLRLFYNHPGFIEAMAERVEVALRQIPAERRDAARLAFTAHSIPMAMAERSPYVAQLREACGLVAASLGEKGKAEGGMGIGWDLVFQSRSGAPSQVWLEPDVRDYLRGLREQGDVRDVVLAPIGFLCECMELAYDLDVEVASLCEELGINLVRASAVGSHPRLVRMIRELIMERLDPAAPRLAMGTLGPWPDDCPADCCA